MGFYPNGYRAKHSEFLQTFFSISPIGVDYYNSKNVAFEFKETNAKDEKSRFFKIPKEQVNASDYVVFCVNRQEFYVVDTKDIERRYKFENKNERAVMRLPVVREMAIYKTTNPYELKQVINNTEGEKK